MVNAHSMERAVARLGGQDRTAQPSTVTVLCSPAQMEECASVLQSPTIVWLIVSRLLGVRRLFVQISVLLVENQITHWPLALSCMEDHKLNASAHVDTLGPDVSQQRWVSLCVND
jgi:hypothetical protein